MVGVGCRWRIFSVFLMIFLVLKLFVWSKIIVLLVIFWVLLMFWLKIIMGVWVKNCGLMVWMVSLFFFIVFLMNLMKCVLWLIVLKFGRIMVGCLLSVLFFIVVMFSCVYWKRFYYRWVCCIVFMVGCVFLNVRKLKMCFCICVWLLIVMMMWFLSV